jgi:hypothetical protein
VVFVGGTVPALYPLETGTDVRPTLDVDCVVDLESTASYYAFIARLRDLGFKECRDEGAPLCRLVYRGVRLDVNAAVATGIGPTNQWYVAAIRDAEFFEAEPACKVLAITPVYFFATKLEAFRGRGRGDFQASHDLEDVLAVLSGLDPLRREVAEASTPVAQSVRDTFVELARIEAFMDAVPGHFEGDTRGQAHAENVLAWLATLGT